MLRVVSALLVVLLAACSAASDQSAGDGALGGTSPNLPFEESGAGRAPDHTGPAVDLAPSQVSGATVPTPATPGPCEPDDLEFWTAQVRAGDSTADAVIRVRNVGDAWCEPDISGSPRLDPEIEPDVWLERTGSADLVVGQRAERCDDPSVVTAAEIDVAGEAIMVPTAVVSCEWWLTAFYPVDSATNACEPDQLELEAVAAGVVVTNLSLQPCGLGPLVEVDGGDPASRSEDSGGPRISDLMPGDVVLFGSRGDACGDGTETVRLWFEAVGEMSVDDVPCDVLFEFGGGRPWFGAAEGPLAPFAVERPDIAAVLEALDPFGSTS